MSVELKPCPFCGQAPSVAEEDGVTLYCEAGSDDWFVSCDMCGANGRYGDKRIAIAAWNTRALSPSHDDGLEALRRISTLRPAGDVATATGTRALVQQMETIALSALRKAGAL